MDFLYIRDFRSVYITYLANFLPVSVSAFPVFFHTWSFLHRQGCQFGPKSSPGQKNNFCPKSEKIRDLVTKRDESLILIILYNCHFYIALAVRMNIQKQDVLYFLNNYDL